MKTKLLAALLAAAAVTPFAAQAQNAYVGASVGRSELKASIDGSSGKENKTGVKVFGGYQFNPTFGLEGGYVDLGKVSDSFDGDSASFESTAVYAAATGTLPLSNGFSLFGKVGAVANRTKARVSGVSFSSSASETNTSAMVGIGAAYALSKNVSLTVEFEHFGKALEEDGFDLKTNLLSIGARYKF